MTARKSKVVVETYYIEDATEPLNIIIDKQCIKDAKQKDPQRCAVANGIRKCVPLFEAVEVGSNITKVTIGKTTLRYNTTERLKRGLQDFDRTGEWKLPEGVYTLLPPCEGSKLAKNRSIESRKKDCSYWKKFKKNLKNGTTKKTGISVFKCRALPTRRVSRVNTAGIPLNN